MSDITFNEEGPGSQEVGQNKTPKMIGWVLKTGLVKSEQQANYVLLGIALAAFLLAAFFLFF